MMMMMMMRNIQHITQLETHRESPSFEFFCFAAENVPIALWTSHDPRM
jgi:hypothetical protein